MAFFVRKTLATGALRFGVQPGQLAAADSAGGFSTGPRGEFVRRSNARLVFGDERTSAIAAAEALAASEEKDSLWTPLRRPRYIALFAVGAILLFLGILVVTRMGPQGWIEVVLGLGLIAVPFIVTAQQRRAERLRQEAARRERAEEEARMQAMVGELSQQLNSLRQDYRPAALAAVRQQRISRDVPYVAFMPVAKSVAVDIAFDALAREGADDPKAFSSTFDSVADAVGLHTEDAADAKAQVLERLFWHLAADGRISPHDEQLFNAYSRALGVDESSFPRELSTARQLREVSDVTPAALPEVPAPIEMKFRELCHHVSSGRLVKRLAKPEGGRAVELIVTSARVILHGAKREIPLAKVFDLEIDADQGVLSIGTDEGKLLHIVLEDPITTAAMIDAARQRAAERPLMA